VIGGEPRNADDAYRSLTSGKIEPAAATDTLADGLRATLCPLTFSILRERADEVSLVTEEEIVQAMLLLWERAKVVVEPSGAVAAAPALFRKISYRSSIGRQSFGGNAILQKFGAGESNSIGIWNPSGISREGRTTLHATFSFVPECSSTKRVSGGKLCFRINIAP
jgi:threonine dehydratase